MKTKKLTKKNYDVIIGGNAIEDSFNLCFCPVTDGPTLEIWRMSRKDMLELQSAVNCALMPDKRKKMPNKQSLAAIREAKSGKLARYKTVKALMDDLKGKK